MKKKNINRKFFKKFKKKNYIIILIEFKRLFLILDFDNPNMISNKQFIVFILLLGCLK